MARILSISYIRQLRESRQLLLESMGHEVVSIDGFAPAMELCQENDRFDLAVLGHSIPPADKRTIIEHCRERLHCRVLALLRADETPPPGADRSVGSSDPQAFCDAVSEMLAEDVSARGPKRA